MMDILPILKSFGHNKLGALLIMLQFAITLAVVCNCLFIIQDNLRQVGLEVHLEPLERSVNVKW